MDKAVIEFILTNQKNAAQFIIYAAKERKGIHYLMRELDNFYAYTRKMLNSGGVTVQIDKDKAEERHIEEYSKLLEKILHALIIELYSKKNYSTICNRAARMAETYSNSKEVIRIDKEDVIKILTGEK